MLFKSSISRHWRCYYNRESDSGVSSHRFTSFHLVSPSFTYPVKLGEMEISYLWKHVKRKFPICETMWNEPVKWNVKWCEIMWNRLWNGLWNEFETERIVKRIVKGCEIMWNGMWNEYVAFKKLLSQCEMTCFTLWNDTSLLCELICTSRLIPLLWRVWPLLYW